PELVIPCRFRGPAGSGNGGYVCGRIAAYADGPLTVTLRRPPPLATPMTVEPAGEGSLCVRHGSTLIAEATVQASRPAVEVPVPASLADARASAGHARYFQDPLFPQCFVCGPSRSPGDGLRIFPGLVPGRTLWAAPWTPDSSVTGKDGRVRPEVAWAALDCPSGIAAAEHARLGPDTAIVLGQMTASLTTLPAAGEQCRVIAWPEGGGGRKLTAGSALIGPGDEVLGVARAVWITVPRPAAETAGSAS
ncbi:MAG TPA: hypothetical protein VHF26_12225, partial [Trebonia sp.]|nr:hypothetical protein [Trebonia sp.]